MRYQHKSCKQCSKSHARCSHDPYDGTCPECERKSLKCSYVHHNDNTSRSDVQLPTSTKEDPTATDLSIRASSPVANQSTTRPLESERSPRPRKKLRTRSIAKTPGRPSIQATALLLGTQANASNNGEQSHPLTKGVSSEDISINAPSVQEPPVVEDEVANVQISNQQDSDRNNIHQQQGEDVIVNENNLANTGADSTMSEKKRGKQPVDRHDSMTTGLSNLHPNASASSAATEQNTSADTSGSRVTRRNSNRPARQTVASGPSTQAAREHSLSPITSSEEEEEVISSTPSEIASVDDLFGRAVDSYFAWPAIVMPILVEDQFRTECQNGQVNRALQIAVICCGIAFTNTADKARILRGLVNDFLRYSRFTPHGTGATLFKLRLDHLVANTLMSRFTIDNSPQMPDLTNRLLPYHTIVLEAVDISNEFAEIADADLQSQLEMACWYLLAITSLQSDDLYVSKSGRQQLTTALKYEDPPFDPPYGLVVERLAATAHHIHEILNADKIKTEGSSFSEVHEVFEKLNKWRVNAFSPWMINQLGTSDDGEEKRHMDDYSFFLGDKMRSTGLQIKTLLRIAVLKVVHINLFLRIAHALPNTITGGDQELARSELQARVAHTAARSIVELSYLTDFMAENTGSDSESDLWMRAAPFAIGDMRSELARLMQDRA